MRIGYLTDIHLRDAVPGTSRIARRRCREMRALLPACLDRMSAHEVDLVLCTGDVVDDPDDPRAGQDLELVRKLFEQHGLQYIVVPGNHDPVPEIFYRVFPRPPRRQSVDENELVVFVDDVCVAGEDACTRSSEEMRALEQTLSASLTPAGVTIAAQHYLIYPPRNEEYPHNYRNDVAIHKVMAQSAALTGRTILSISGHYHPGVAPIECDGVWYLIGRAFCEAPHGYAIITLERGGFDVDQRDLATAARRSSRKRGSWC
jgi:predicted MPP superfamily phosphohydrolase